MEKLKALPASMLLLLDDLKGRVEEMAATDSATDRAVSLKAVQRTFSVMSQMCSEAADSVEGTPES